ncbi:metal-dependent hydrolase [bacterium]|jgi:hypothetical protein|nr:metal-dependent hydrolase [bacterium]
MFILGHLGIGKKIANPWIRGASLPWFFFGALLPDLIDKPLYYGLASVTGLSGLDLGLISGTRTVGHTFVFLLTMASVAAFSKSRKLSSVCLGVATHILLDSVMDQIGIHKPEAAGSIAYLFPLKGWRFPVSEHTSLREHFLSLRKIQIVVAEGIGVALLIWDYWKEHHTFNILQNFRLKRNFFRKRKWRGVRRSN